MKRPAQPLSKLLTLLDHHYPNPQVPLYHFSPYTLLIAVLLSQQSTDKKVNEITPLLFAKAKTCEEMIAFGIEEIQKLIRPIGLSPQKAANIVALSHQILEEFDGQVPNTLESLMSLPGVGRKTALCVLAQAFGQPAFPVDTHIIRLANRWGLTTSKDPFKVELALTKLFSKDLWPKIHLQIIFAGREFCRASPHNPDTCPSARYFNLPTQKKYCRQTKL